jgi:signal transduction histidine kinase
LSAANGRSEIHVIDTGVGIDHSELPRVFERFYRADKSRNRDSGGTGLGLSIAKWIAEVHDGAIEARSEPNRGTTFVITLPGIHVS